VTPEQVRAELAGDLAPSTLVLGSGAGVLVSGVCAGHGWAYRDGLNAEAARQVRDEAWFSPLDGLRVTALCMDGASARVQNMLLKTLEEPPAGTRFVLAAGAWPLPTVVSRCRVLVLGQAVADAEVPDDRDLAAVGSALRMARAGERPALARAIRAWSPACPVLLVTWAAEAASGRWAVFSPGFAAGTGQDQAVRLLAELSRWGTARIGLQVALDRVLGPE
jgi:hypothetical protein